VVQKVPVISVSSVSFDVGQSLSTFVVALCAEFAHYLDDPVPVPSVTLLQDWITH